VRNSLFSSIRTKLLPVFISVLPVLGIVLYSGLTILQKDIVRTESDILRVVRTLAYDHERTDKGLSSPCGTGLGLAIVWGTVKDHNGYIDIQTEAGEGTTFTRIFLFWT
jgi:hypothetical protein